MIRLAMLVLMGLIVLYVSYTLDQREVMKMKFKDKVITKEQLASYEEAIELSEAYDHADTRTFVALKKEYRAAKRLYKKQQREAAGK